MLSHNFQSQRLIQTYTRRQFIFSDALHISVICANQTSEVVVDLELMALKVAFQRCRFNVLESTATMFTTRAVPVWTGLAQGGNANHAACTRFSIARNKRVLHNTPTNRPPAAAPSGAHLFRAPRDGLTRDLGEAEANVEVAAAWLAVEAKRRAQVAPVREPRAAAQHAALPLHRPYWID